MAQTKQFGVGYPAATLPLDGTETISVVQGGVTKDVAVSALGTGGTPGGADTQVQFNDGGTFGGDAGLVYAKATDTLTAGRIVTAASAAAQAGLNTPHGAAPTSPVNGDIWTTTAGLFARINGVTVGPFATSAGSGIPSGTSNPGSPVAGQQFFRTDLGRAIYYDGARWLTMSEMALSQSAATTAAAGLTATTLIERIAVRQDFGIYLTRWALVQFINGTSSGAAFWTGTIDRYSATNVATNVATAVSTGAGPDPTTNWVNHDVAINAVLDATARELAVTMTRTGTPGNLFYASQLYGRLIIT